MKTVNKSKLMKRARAIYKDGHNAWSESFSSLLKRAWEIEKKNIEYNAQKELIGSGN